MSILYGSWPRGMHQSTTFPFMSSWWPFHIVQIGVTEAYIVCVSFLGPLCETRIGPTCATLIGLTCMYNSDESDTCDTRRSNMCTTV
jgi:hypothetical protein